MANPKYKVGDVIRWGSNILKISSIKEYQYQFITLCGTIAIDLMTIDYVDKSSEYVDFNTETFELLYG